MRRLKLGHLSRPDQEKRAFAWKSRRSLSYLLLGSALATVGAAAFTSYWVVRNLILSDLKSNAQFQVQQSRDEIDQWFSVLLEQMQNVANSSAARSMNWSVAKPHLQLELDRLTEFHLLALVKPDGSYYNTQVDRANANLRDREEFQWAIAGKATVGNPVVSKTLGIRQVNIVVPIWSVPPLNRSFLSPQQATARARNLAALKLPASSNQVTKPIGTMLGSVRIERVLEVVTKTTMGEGSYAFALDSKGVPIAHPNQALGEGAQPILHGSDPDLRLVSKAMLEGQQGVELVQMGKEQVYIAYTPLRQANWSLALVIPHANLEHHLQALNLLAAVFGALLVAAAIVAIRQIRLLEHAHQHTEQLNQTLTELKKTQSQLIQTEKMSSLGQMVAGIAHEINNPINFINGNITHASDYVQELLDLVELYQRHYPNPTNEIQAQIKAIDLDFLIEDLVKLLNSMKLGADRIREIVLSLRNFSRLDEAAMKPIDIHEGIDSTLLILQNRLKETPAHPGIRVVKEYGDLPLVECYAGQLNQVFMNILSNAIDILEENFELKVNETGLGRKTAAQTTLPEKPDLTEPESAPVPTITIRTQLEDDGNVVIRIADNGPGMVEEVRNRLFDPFFTTKPVGKGTGLGLSISYQIVVDKHGGSLKCFSEPGQGAEFWIEIPICQNQPDPPAILVEPKPEKMLVP